MKILFNVEKHKESRHETEKLCIPLFFEDSGTAPKLTRTVKSGLCDFDQFRNNKNHQKMTPFW